MKNASLGLKERVRNQSQISYTSSKGLICTVIHEDRKYLEFGREIKVLGENLEGLVEVIRKVQGDDISSNLGSLLEITGDFTETLKACQKVLSDNSKFCRNKADFVDNVLWWVAGTERVVIGLRERCRLHSMKVLNQNSIVRVLLEILTI